MLSKEEINSTVNAYLTDTDYYLVDIKVTPDNQIKIEIDSFAGVSLDFCVELTRHFESVFDREVEDYELEIGSAGITEPFKVIQQYTKNIGNEVEVLTKNGKKLCGILNNVDNQTFTVEVDKLFKEEGSKRKTSIKEEITFSYEEIKYTKYIIRFK